MIVDFASFRNTITERNIVNYNGMSMNVKTEPSLMTDHTFIVGKYVDKPVSIIVFRKNPKLIKFIYD